MEIQDCTQVDCAQFAGFDEALNPLDERVHSFAPQIVGQQRCGVEWEIEGGYNQNDGAYMKGRIGGGF